VWPWRQARQDRCALGDKVETGCVALETGETGSSAFGDIGDLRYRLCGLGAR
jgi:hypothetical protein